MPLERQSRAVGLTLQVVFNDRRPGQSQDSWLLQQLSDYRTHAWGRRSTSLLSARERYPRGQQLPAQANVRRGEALVWFCKTAASKMNPNDGKIYPKASCMSGESGRNCPQLLCPERLGLRHRGVTSSLVPRNGRSPAVVEVVRSRIRPWHGSMEEPS
jgi:hypothetical protein